jgi:hypothetical protein
MLLVLSACFVVWQKAEGRTEASATMPALSGEEAVSYLKQQGLYGSLSEAMSTARYAVQWSKNTPWKASPGAFYANNPAQQMTAFFTPNGIHLRAKTARDKQGWKVGMKLSAYGYGENLEPVAAGEVKVQNNRVEIRRQNGLTEWYVNQAEGIEHGFRIATPPAGRKSGKPLRLRLELEGSLQATQLADTKGIELRGAKGEQALRYDKLHVFDAEGRELEASLRAAGKQVWLEVAESEAVYPLTIDPTFSQQQKLSASDGASLDNFGDSVAISGETLVVGATGDDIGANGNQGSAYVFVRAGATWSEQQKLTASDGAAGDVFGGSVAISGETFVIAARSADTGANLSQGSAYVFVRTGSSWTQQQKLLAADGAASDQFGFSVAISGETIVVGASRSRIGPEIEAGSAYVFVRTGTAWSQQQKLIASDAEDFDRFGSSVAISGETIVVGAPEILDAHYSGSAYVFVRIGVSWSQQQKLALSGEDDMFGTDVAISGETIVIGVWLDDIGANQNQGSAHVFVRTGTVWSQQQKLTASDGTGEDYFGKAVAISGETIVVGSYNDRVGSNFAQGSAYVFACGGAQHWTEQAKTTSPNGAIRDGFGSSVAISGETIVISASGDDIGANINQGSVYVFVRTGINWSLQQKLTAADGAAFDSFGFSIAISNETIAVSASGSAYVFVRTGTSWSQQQKLTALDGAAFDNFGYSIAISNETIVVGVIYDDIGASFDQGSAYVFVRTGTNWSQQQKLTAADGIIQDTFGYSVAISGETLVVSTPNSDVGTNISQGSAYVFVRTGTSWSQLQKLTAADGTTGDFFGYEVAISGDTIVVGAGADDIGANEAQGSAYVFVRTGASWSQMQKLTASDGGAFDQFGVSVATSGATTVVSAVNNQKGVFRRFVYVFSRDCIFINYDVCLQDDNNAGTVLRFNSATGEYRFCGGSTTYTGTGVVGRKGGTITLQHNTSDRRLEASIDTSQNRGKASLQSPPAAMRQTIIDGDTRNNTCSCGTN